MYSQEKSKTITHIRYFQYLGTDNQVKKWEQGLDVRRLASREIMRYIIIVLCI